MDLSICMFVAFFLLFRSAFFCFCFAFILLFFAFCLEKSKIKAKKKQTKSKSKKKKQMDKSIFPFLFRFSPFLFFLFSPFILLLCFLDFADLLFSFSICFAFFALFFKFLRNKD